MQLLIYYYFISFPPCNLLQLIATFYILCYESIDFEALCNKCCKHIKHKTLIINTLGRCCYCCKCYSPKCIYGLRAELCFYL